MIGGDRIQVLNSRPAGNGRYVLYWMQSSHRTTANLALELAVARANELRIPVLACFCTDISYPGATFRHYQFMAEGLLGAGRALENLGIRLVLLPGPPESAVPDCAEDAALVVTDVGYLSLHRQWREDVAKGIGCQLIQVEDNVVVPVRTASVREEWSAGTIRVKIRRHMMNHLESPGAIRAEYPSFSLDTVGSPYQDAEMLPSLAKDGLGSPSPIYRGGQDEAVRRLERFISRDLARYPLLRNDPASSVLSGMSPYLHFGQVSPIYIARRVLESGDPAAESFLEEMIVRRELSMNFVTYNILYDRYDGLPAWSRKTLALHSRDPREYLYVLEEFEKAQTHDPYWNAAQKEMLVTGKMHGYMRMYWGKKILEWSESPEQAYQTALSLNNRYELDGRDPNGYAGVAWCFGKHDRAWSERPVFGKIRYMNANGLKRKFRIDDYVAHVDALVEEFSPGKTI